MPAEMIATSNSKPASCPIGRWIQRLTRRWRARSDIAAGCRKGCWGSRWGAECYLTETERQSGFRIEPYAAARIDSRSEEHTSELQSLMRISYAVFCLKNKNKTYQTSKETIN